MGVGETQKNLEFILIKPSIKPILKPVAKPSKVAEEPQARARKKEQTRQKLIQAALNLVNGGSSFTALGIREITREAGVVPTAFYRHFRNTDELGLALVEEGGMTLRRLFGPDPADLPSISVLPVALDSYDALVANTCMGEVA